MKILYKIFAISLLILTFALSAVSQIAEDPMKFPKYFTYCSIGYAENFEPIDTIYSIVAVDFTSPTIPGKTWKKLEACCGAPNGDVITVTVFYDAQNAGINPTVKRPYVVRCVAGDRCTAGTYKVNCPPEDSCDILDRYMEGFYQSYDSTGRRVARTHKAPDITIENGSDMD